MWASSRIKHRLKDVPVQSSIQCLPRELSLPTDGVLRIKPLRELEQLRQEERSAGGMTIPVDASRRLENIADDTLELSSPSSLARPGSLESMPIATRMAETASPSPMSRRQKC